jgi:carotenoid cleavage dioxygenase-like enzyme
MHAFPDLPIYTGFNMPGRFEIDIEDLEVIGEVPAEMNGMFFRASPDPQFPPMLGTDIYFNGDGAITQFRFKRGRVSMKHRPVRTEKFNLERAAGKSLYGAYRNPHTDDFAVQGKSRGTANTNVLLHAGQLFAYKEDSLPVAMDPISLETRGECDFGGRMQSKAFTAHAKLDPINGELVGFGYGAKGVFTRDVAYYVIGADGRIKHETWFEVPYANLMHDFGVTRDYVVWPIIPVCSSEERAKAGKNVFAWDGSREIYLAVLPRYGKGCDLKLFRGPTQFCSHVMNAFNEGTKVHIDVPVCNGNMFPFFPDTSGKPFDRDSAMPRMMRWTVDMARPGSGIESRRLGELVGEFPRIDDRFAMGPYRHGYLCVIDPSRAVDTEQVGSITGMFINCWGHIDHATGKEDAYWVGPRSSLQEPAFVPKSKDAAEGEGYIIGLANRLTEMRSDLLVLDAQRLSAGPIATIRLPVRLRNGLHGNWFTNEQLGI